MHELETSDSGKSVEAETTFRGRRDDQRTGPAGAGAATHSGGGESNSGDRCASGGGHRCTSGHWNRHESSRQR